jgi:DNA modification methylase
MTHTVIHAEDIHVEERQRQSFPDKGLDDLADSILRVGLIHAPVLTEDFTLVVGERRLRALALTESMGTYKYAGVEMEYPEIPVHIVPYKDEELLFEIELEENLRRENLTAMEQAQAIAKLHNVRKQEVPTQTIKATAQEVASLQGKEPTARDESIVAEALLVDQFADDPEVQKAAKQSMRKAAKVARKKMELDFLAALQGGTKHESEFFNVYHGDCGSVMEKLEPRSYDILLFDPPYGVGADSFGEQAHALGHQYEDSFDAAAIFLDAVMDKIHLLKDNAHILMFCSPDLFHDWKRYYESRQLQVWPRALIWDKGNGHLPVPERGPRYTYESILFATKGQRTVSKVINDVLRVPPVRDKLHAAEKPAELLRQLMEFVARPGDHILDPCCGSGSIFAGARGLEVYVDGIELDEKYYHVARERAV